MTVNILIRHLKKEEVPLLKDFMYAAVYCPPKKQPYPKNVIYIPVIYEYIKGFGRKSDVCLIAEKNGLPSGAVWSRIMPSKVKDFEGFADENTPEITIAVLEKFRKNGIGTLLLEKMLKLLKKESYMRVSLRVEKENFAVNMYKKSGFRTVKENKDDYFMILDLCEFNKT